MLLVVVEDAGTKTIHYQEAKDCFGFLSTWRENKRKGNSTILTFELPKVSGEVIDAYCVKSDGRIWDAYGYSYKRLGK